ncbi:MAG: hypothetical protein SGBAC_003674 [Bacillariaceae sp.]
MDNNRISPSPLPYHQHRSSNATSTTMRQRRGSQKQTELSQRDNRNGHDVENHHPPKRRQNVKRRRPAARKKNRYLARIYYAWCRLSSYFLVLAILIWILVQIHGTLLSTESQQASRVSARTTPRDSRFPPKEFAHRSDREEDKDEDEEANKGLANWFGFANKNINNNNNKKHNKEAIPNGCELQEWQQVGHPNCMDLHQLDLSLLLKDAFQDTTTNNDNNNNNNTTTTTATALQSGKYLSSGMWRDVFRLPAAAAATHPPSGHAHNAKDAINFVVLKMMKSEHDVDDRNLERHLREAIVMDVLNNSPRIVNLFAYCGTSVLTEYLPMDLEAYLRPKTRTKRKRIRRGQKGPLSDEKKAPRVTTAVERLDLALQTAKAVEELHQHDIIHADLQSKQFLVDLETSSGVTVKLNDFNRCRFLPREKKQPARLTDKKNTTSRSSSSRSSLSMNSSSLPPPICPILIPTAPGLARSPEEYEMQPLTTQLDIYSLANVWYQILTGSSPWAEQSNMNVVKNLILNGKKPPLKEELLQVAGGSDKKKEKFMDVTLADLLYSAYETDPNHRATAKDLVEGLERWRDK